MNSYAPLVQAVEAVVPQDNNKDEAFEKSISPHIESIAQLRTEMERKGLREPDRLYTSSGSANRNSTIDNPMVS